MKRYIAPAIFGILYWVLINIFRATTETSGVFNFGLDDAVAFAAFMMAALFGRFMPE